MSTRLKVVLAFAAVYIVWGTTYLGIRFAIATIPPLLMAGTRFMIAGALVALWCQIKKEPSASREDRWHALALGALLLVGGNGLVTWAEQRIPSGVAALLISTEPIWLAVLLLVGRRSVKPTPQGLIAMLLGLIGVGILTSKGSQGATRLDPWAIGAVLLATLSWGAGSIWSSRIDPPRSMLRQVAWQMFSAGVAMSTIGLLMGEGAQLHPESISVRSGLAFGYLVVFGSIVAFLAYTYLLKEVSPTMVSTYAYVNPAIAVFAGWAIGGEHLGLREIGAMAVIVAAVVLLIRSSAHQPQREPDPLGAEAACAT